MELTGEYRIPASRERVWEALNDPDVLKASIPGCETLERTGEDGYAATVTAKVGPVKAKFKGAVTLSDLDPPNSYTISGEGKGGAAGFARGSARVTLAEDGGETVLAYVVDANVGGKLAQIGSRLIDGAAKKLADEFFTKFSEAAATAAPAEAGVEAEVEAALEAVPEAVAAEEAAPPPAAEEEALPPEPAAGRGVPTWLWVGGLALLVLLLLFAFTD
ncbi:MAG: carbon monoxide dehydrogenase subunit G [Alphaproteobacteria bacterium]|jgi:hypothetical protein|nr:carbon monoxide dehydrogenase subunit G [Alphaproteobacteria bacterium]